MLDVRPTSIWTSQPIPLAKTTSHVWQLVLKDSGKIAESPMPPLIPLIGAVSVLLVTKVQMPVLLVLDLCSKTVPDVNPAGSKMDQMAVSLVTPNVPPAQVPVMISAQNVRIPTLEATARPLSLEPTSWLQPSVIRPVLRIPTPRIQ